MRKKLLLALLAASVAGTAGLATGAREAKADESLNCFVTPTHACGCPECVWKNCTCKDLEAD